MEEKSRPGDTGDNMTAEDWEARAEERFTARRIMALSKQFDYGHLRAELREVSKPFCDLAHGLIVDLPINSETEATLRKLLEAKDCAVRARLAA